METESYFNSIRERTEDAYDIAERARSQNRDPEPRVDIPVAEDLPEKASSLVIAAKFPELEGKGVADRIKELEGEHGKNDERVAFEIGREIAEGRFHEFEELERACDAGVRVGVSYMTGGITTAPLEGIGDVRIRKNDDGSQYLAVYYSGPIRSAGGTASAMSVLLADYVRKSVDLDRFKPSETIVKRYATEVDDYYNRVTAKQYYPEREETELISENVPVEVTGSPTEQIEVSNYKDLDLIDTNQIRGGMCLVYLDGLPLKAPKIKKRIKKWGDEFGLEHWEWIEDYLELQKEIHSEGDDDEDDEDGKERKEYTPDDKYLGSLTAGRPVFGHPGKKGGFRIRYGHTRNNGLAAVSVHPATMEVTERFLATGTQIKTEYPMKATVSMPSDAAHPPIVKLDNGTVERVETRERAREVEDSIDEILFLGDMITTYGEFVENGKALIPSPYVPEWWEKDLERTLEERDMELGKKIDTQQPDVGEAFKISEATGIPLHPRWTHHWNETEPGNVLALRKALKKGEITPGSDAKECLEDILVQHRVEAGEVKVEADELKAIRALLKPEKDASKPVEKLKESGDIPQFIEEVSGFEVREQAPHYMGARMGRPEKAEKRLIEGRPQMLFPCGKEEGGRMRNLSASYKKGTVSQQIIHYRCHECQKLRHYARCPECGVETSKLWFCSSCGSEYDEKTQKCESCGGERLNRYKNSEIDVKAIMDRSLKNLEIKKPPELLKSVRGMSSKHKHVEPIEKGLLRQKHGLYVNKDGTVRYDATDLPMTHFKPREISTSVDKLRDLGYTEDVNGNPLNSEEQVIALKPQDIVIPDGEDTFAASDYFVDVANFIDELLERFYGLESYYDAEDKHDIIGKLVIGLAPHTSGGTVGRIIGFTDAKGIYAHPYWHAGKRRNADGDEDAILLLMDGLLNFSRQYLPDVTGARTMDAPLILSTVLNPDEVDDEAWAIETVSEYPLEFYEETHEYLPPWEIETDIEIGEDIVYGDKPFEHGYTHESTDVENGPSQSEYVTLGDMAEKTSAQLGLGEKLKCVDEHLVAELLLKKHFIPDIKGNLRSFSSQKMRCVDCNEKFRRVPIRSQTIAPTGKTTAECPECGGKVLLTISEGTIKKYMVPSEDIVDEYSVSPYVRQQVMILKHTLQSLFGKDHRQSGIKQFT